MEAIILAGGLGSRLRSVVTEVPKPMAPIGSRPFLEILLTSLSSKGFHRVILSVGHMAETIIDHFGSEYLGLDLSYALEDKPLGTGGAARLAMEHAESDHTFVLNGDTFLDLEVSEVEAMWQRKKRSIIVAREVPETRRFGRLHVQGEMAIRFSEKQTFGPGLINAGCYVFARGQLASLPSEKHLSLERDYLTKAISNGEFDFFLSRGKFIDIGLPEDYSRAQSELSGIA